MNLLNLYLLCGCGTGNEPTVGCGYGWGAYLQKLEKIAQISWMWWFNWLIERRGKTEVKHNYPGCGCGIG